MASQSISLVSCSGRERLRLFFSSRIVRPRTIKQTCPWWVGPYYRPLPFIDLQSFQHLVPNRKTNLIAIEYLLMFHRHKTGTSTRREEWNKPKPPRNDSEYTLSLLFKVSNAPKTDDITNNNRVTNSQKRPTKNETHAKRQVFFNSPLNSPKNAFNSFNKRIHPTGPNTSY